MILPALILTIVFKYIPMYGQVNVARPNSFGFFKGRTVISSANQNLELTAKWIDKCYDPIQSIQDNWGTYGDKNQQNVFQIETPVKAYAERMKAKWISKGGVENQWNGYLEQLDKLGLPKILEIKQKGLDNYNVSNDDN